MLGFLKQRIGTYMVLLDHKMSIKGLNDLIRAFMQETYKIMKSYHSSMVHHSDHFQKEVHIYAIFFWKELSIL